MEREHFSFLELLKVALISLAIVLPIRYFLMQPFFVKGASMEPNYEDGQYLIIDEISWRFREPKRGEVTVFKYSKDTSQYYIKRIIGLPNETIKIENNQVSVLMVGTSSFEKLEEKYLDSTQITEGDVTVKLADDEYFVMGDNRLASYDSRRFGPVQRSYFVGRAWIRAWPFGAAVLLPSVQYSLNK